MQQVIITTTLGQYCAGLCVSVCAIFFSGFVIVLMLHGQGLWGPIDGLYPLIMNFGMMLPGGWIFCSFCWHVIRRFRTWHARKTAQ